MTEPKTRCTRCGVEILETTAVRTGGLCKPCKTGGPRRPDPTIPVEISCCVASDDGLGAIFYTSAQELLQQLNQARHIGDSMHPNKFELEAQKALLRHAIRHRANFRLNDDHWGRTGFLLLSLFEEQKAILEVNGRRFTFPEVCKEEWSEGSDPLASHGGILYRNTAGNIIYKRSTWVS